MSRPNPYSVDLDRNRANYAPLTPLTFIEWSAAVYPDRIAVVHGARRFTWRETYGRSVRLASALAHNSGLASALALEPAAPPRGGGRRRARSDN